VEPPPESSAPWPPVRPPLSWVVGPSTGNDGLPFTQLARTSMFCEPLVNSRFPGSAESSDHQPAAGTPASTGRPLVQSAITVPPPVTCRPVAAARDGAVLAVDVVGAAAAPRNEPVGEADASTRDTARKPRPTAAAA